MRRVDVPVGSYGENAMSNAFDTSFAQIDCATLTDTFIYNVSYICTTYMYMA